MTKDPFSGLAALLPSDGGTVKRSREAVAELLLASAEKLTEIRDYIDSAGEPTSAKNLELLRNSLDAIIHYLIPFMKTSLKGTIEPTKDTVTVARRHTRTLKHLMKAWDERVKAWEESGKDRPLREIGSDYDAVLEKQDELVASLTTLVDHLGVAQQEMKEDMQPQQQQQQQHSSPSIHEGQGSPPDRIGEGRSHHSLRRRQIG